MSARRPTAGAALLRQIAGVPVQQISRRRPGAGSGDAVDRGSDGSGRQFRGAFSKAQLSAGTPLPEKGTVFISVNEKYKPEVVPIGKRFAELGFDLVAT